MNIWQKAIDFSNRMFEVSSGLSLPRGGYWPWYTTVSLNQSNERLDSIRLLLLKNYSESSEVLLRSLFEIAVNLAYISRDVSTRLPGYLRHGHVDLPTEDAERLEEKANRLREEIISGEQPDVTGIAPTKVWKRLRIMCQEMGSPWLEDCNTFYPLTSDTAHAGSLTLNTNIVQLRYHRLPSAHTKAVCLVTALAFHLSVLEVAADVFPGQIELPKVLGLKSELATLGQFLASHAKARARKSQKQAERRCLELTTGKPIGSTPTECR